MSHRININVAKRVAREVYSEKLSKSQIVNRLVKQGWKRVGIGSFAVVLAHDDYPTVAIKVSSASTKRWHGFKDGWPTYVRWMKTTGTRSKFAPKVYAMHGAEDAEVHVTVVERLYKLADKKFAIKAETTSSYIRFGKQITDVDRQYRLPPAPARFLSKIVTLGTIDLHSKNIMQRINGTPVFSDPLCA